MISLLLPLLAATLTSVQAIPYPKRGLAEVISQCHHDFAYTWDDGPYTAHNDIRAAFNNVGGKTTFFANGDNWSCIYDQNNVDALRGSFEAGHQIASHTWSYVVALPYLPQA
ncbi:Carbohydrate esterase 4 protein [Serendipita sp. 397]|nr:Carbohydrate esterase 4 protein [Serendipita sp. 397]